MQPIGVDLDLSGETQSIETKSFEMASEFEATQPVESTMDFTQPMQVNMQVNTPGQGSNIHSEEHIRNMELKLVLAKAYIENGFVDEARALLRDVNAKGNDKQQKQANRLLREAGSSINKRAS